MHRKSLLFILSAPAGTGKTTLINRLVKEQQHICRSLTFTTRLPRKNEVNGVDYNFVTHECFQEKITKGDFLEYVFLFEIE